MFKITLLCAFVALANSTPLLRNSYGLPIFKVDTDYGVPKVAIPSTSYGVPIVPSRTYGVPADYPAPASLPVAPISNTYSYDIPNAPYPQAVPEKPQVVYGPPPTPANVYGPPPTERPTTPAIVYGPPTTPAQVYGPPTTPANVYGVPKTYAPVKTVIRFIIPKTYGPPAEVYGPPPTPARVYGALPVVKQPEGFFGLPTQRPPTPQRIYGTPSQRYGTPF